MRVSKMNEDRLVEVRRKKYLNELLDFYLYGDCLDEDMTEEYFNSIKENIISEMYSKNSYSRKCILTEMTVKGFANTLRRSVFNKRVANSEAAMLRAVQNARKCAEQAKYERDVEKRIIKTGRTHLELDDGTFCTKAQFRQSFANQKFELQDDVSATAPTTMLNEYLKAFDDDGWLISTTDKDGYKDIQSGNVKA